MKRHTGSRSRGFMPAIISRGSRWHCTASEITLGSKWPNETRHFCASGRSSLMSLWKTVEKSCGSTMKRSDMRGDTSGAHNSERRAIVCSAEDEISDCQAVSKYLIRNRLTGDLC